LLREICTLKWQLQSATAALDTSDVAPSKNKLCFKRLLNEKRSRNNQNLPLPSIGVGKLKKLMDLGVNNTVELLQFQDPNNIFWSHQTRNTKRHCWQAEAEDYFEAKCRYQMDLKGQLKFKEDELKAMTSYHDIDEALEPATRELEPGTDTTGVPDLTVTGTSLKPLPSLFSDMTKSLTRIQHTLCYCRAG